MEAKMSNSNSIQFSTGVDESGQPVLSIPGQHDELPLAWHPMPVECFPSIARDYITAVAKAVDADPCMVALPLLSAMASAVGSARRCLVKESWTAPSIIWTCVVARSGTAKSPAADQITDRFREIQDWYAADVEAMTQEGDQNPPDRRIMTTNGTIPGLVNLLTYNPKGLLYHADELAGWLKDQGRYSGSDESDAWNELYNGSTLWHDRKQAKSLKARYPNVCVTGGIQPARLFRAFSQDNFDSGLAARILLAHPPHRIRRLTDADIDDGQKSALRTRLADLLAIDPGYTDPIWSPGLMRLDKAAFRRFAAWHDDRQERMAEVDDALNAAWSKLCGTVPRIAMVFELFVDPESMVVSSDTMARSIELTDWFCHETARIYQGQIQTPENRLAMLLLNTLESFPGSSIREMQRKRRSLRELSADEIESALARLRDGGLVTSSIRNATKAVVWHIVDQSEIVTVTI